MFKRKNEKIEDAPIANIIEEKKDLSNDSGLKELLEKNIKWTQVVYEQNKEIKARLTLTAVASYIKMLIILIPLILAVIYLPPFLSKIFSQYNSLMGGISGKQVPLNEIINSVSPTQIQELLKSINH